jgi:FlaA1/EpsC-like NDP-sugar epimerase
MTSHAPLCHKKEHAVINIFKNKTILITGAVGTIGKELAQQLLAFGPAELRLLDNNESEVFFLHEEYEPLENVVVYLGSIRDRDKLDSVCKGVNIVFHVAAFKHVYLSEYNPFDAVMTNVIGTQNVLKAAVAGGVERVLFTSSDKAVNPTNVMGSTKLLAERMVTAYNVSPGSEKTVFASSRFGNVIGSRGSVVPVFYKQIKRGGPVTVTDPRMTRFVMTIPEAARLVIEACTLAKGGEVFISKMPVIRIVDLAAVMIEMLVPEFGYERKDVQIEYVGAKAGEKMYEELLNSEEIVRTKELTNHFVTLPAFRFMFESIDYCYPGEVSAQVDRPYVSSDEQAMSKEDLKTYLIESKVFDHMEG